MRSVLHGRSAVVGASDEHRLAIGSESMACTIFEGALDHEARRGGICPAYTAGLIRFGDIPYHQLYHFVSAGVVWDSAPLEAALWRNADHLVGNECSWLIIDDNFLPKKENIMLA